jgi:hypothetical protein
MRCALAYYDEAVIESLASAARLDESMTVADIRTDTGFVAGESRLDLPGDVESRNLAPRPAQANPQRMTYGTPWGRCQSRY